MTYQEWLTSEWTRKSNPLDNFWTRADSHAHFSWSVLNSQPGMFTKSLWHIFVFSPLALNWGASDGCRPCSLHRQLRDTPSEGESAHQRSELISGCVSLLVWQYHRPATFFKWGSRHLIRKNSSISKPSWSLAWMEKQGPKNKT